MPSHSTEAGQTLLPQAGIQMPRTRRQRLDQTLIDTMVVGINPVLIMALVGSLVFFLLTAFYQGGFTMRLHFIFAMFVMAIVLISRIAIRENTEYAALFAIPLALVVGIAMMRFVAVDGVSFLFSCWVNFAMMGIVWWAANKLTWDCTLIDEGKDASGEGLLQRVGLEGNDSASQRAEVEKARQRQQRTAVRNNEQPWYRRWTGKRKEAHTPGRWVIYFSLAALPLFGLGQTLIPSSDQVSRQYAFRLLAVYVAAALGLLLTTSFLGLRRYLRQRQIEMPHDIAAVWLGAGTVLIVALLAVCALLPRPGASYDIAAFPIRFKTPDNVRPSRYAVGNDGVQSEQGTRSGSSQPGGNSQSGNSQSGSSQSQSGNSQSGNSQSGSSQSGNSQSGSSQSGNSQSGNSQSGNSQSGNSQSGNSQSGNSQSGSSQSGNSQSGNSQSGNSQSGNSQSGNSQSGNAQSGNAQSGNSQSGNSQSGNSQSGNSQSGNSQSGNSQSGNSQPDSDPKGDEPRGDGSRQNPGADRDPAQSGAENASSGQGGGGENRSQGRSFSGDGQSSQQNASESTGNRSANSSRGRSFQSPVQIEAPGGILTLLFKLILWGGVIAVAGYFIWKYWDRVRPALLKFWLELQEMWRRWWRGKEDAKAEAQEDARPTEAPPQPFSSYANPFRSGLAERVSSGEVIRYSFEALEAFAREAQCARQPEQTPNEFAAALARQFPSLGQDVRRLAELYARLAYAATDPAPNSLRHVQAFWTHVEGVTANAQAGAAI